MPSVQEHADQAANNHALLSEQIMVSNATHYPDWVVTVSFYTAVHVVERELERRHKIHSRNHDERKHLIDTHFPHIRAEYEYLRNESRLSRYRCYAHAPYQLQLILHTLQEIETRI